MLVFLFAALAIRAVGKAAYYVINEVRRQFRERPGILAGHRAAVVPPVRRYRHGWCAEADDPTGLVVVGMPIAVGLVFKGLDIGAEAMAAFLMVGTIAGILLATVLNNSGGAWDNAKKSIESRGTG